MSEILGRHRHIVERLSHHINLRCDRVSWPCDGHECRSCRRSFSQRTQNLTHQQHVLKSTRNDWRWDFKAKTRWMPRQHILPLHNRHFRYGGLQSTSDCQAGLIVHLHLESQQLPVKLFVRPSVRGVDGLSVGSVGDRIHRDEFE